MRVKKIKSSGIIYKVAYSLLCCALGWYLHGKFSPDFSAMMHDNEQPRVLVKALSKGDVSAKKKYIAQVEAINSVDIVPQVSGYLEQILFNDGAYVEKDEQIFLIEQRKYQADLQAAEAAVKQLRNEYNRITSLHKNKYVSDKERDIAESNLEQAEAALDLAKLNLEYTEIKSPISGYIGKALVTAGNLVSPNTQKLARVVQTDPIRIAFSVTDKERSAFMQKAGEAKDVFLDIAMPNGTINTVTARNMFFDNEVNPDTATVPVYIDSDNKDNLLVPGNYVDIYVRFDNKQEALLVPQVALSADVNGSYVMTVNKDNIVEQKYIELGDVIEDMQVVKSGLNGHEQVIIQGLQKVRNGIKVQPTLLSKSNN
ncbi:MAG: efflux RND transporter periplasmic adaptor subunit [Alphaproteobacteria bacterium]|nr:efflux RND transporter periplasmic adaptor subunit [Alphaproteobacteria bacterium]